MRFTFSLPVWSIFAVQCLASALTVTITNGTVVGRYLPSFEQDLFLGVPYSDPPLRFQNSVGRTTKFSGDFDASNYSSVCYALGKIPSGSVMSEDCLSLNIIRPTGSSKESSLPVVIWIHGGGFMGGSAADPQYNGSYIVRQSVEQGTPIIFVSIQYRLLFYGFPSGNEPHSLGVENLGLKDQRLAFQWVQENILEFGGNPKKVTIMGESAGGTAILQHLVAYGGRNDGLFQAAIIESGSFYDMPCNGNISKIREENYQKFLNSTGCTDFDCLETLSNDVLFKSAIDQYTDFLPSIDGEFMQAHPVQMFNEGKFLSVPLLMGVNDDEGSVLVTPGINTVAELQSALTDANGSSYSIDATAFSKLFELYPDDPAQGVPHNTGSGLLPSGLMDKTSFLIFGDAIEHSPRRWITGLLAAADNAVFSYTFAQVPWKKLMIYGATHGYEMTYVFGNTNPDISYPLGPRPSDLRLSAHMTGAWASFVYSHNPNHSNSSITWPDYRVAKQNMVFVADGEHVQKDTYRNDGINLWIEQRIQGCVGIVISA